MQQIFKWNYSQDGQQVFHVGRIGIVEDGLINPPSATDRLKSG